MMLLQEFTCLIDMCTKKKGKNKKKKRKERKERKENDICVCMYILQNAWLVMKKKKKRKKGLRIYLRLPRHRLLAQGLQEMELNLLIQSHVDH